MGHDVTLYASADSRTTARLVPCAPRALRLAGCRDWLAPHLAMLERLAERATDFDLIHFHLSHLHLPLARRLPTPSLTTLHGRLDLPELGPLYHETYWDQPLVSISDAQRAPLPHAGWIGTVHHGLPAARLPFSPGPGRYLAFLGRISPEKRADRAIEIAIASGQPLKIAAKVDPVDRAYFEELIRPLLDHPLIEFLDEIGDADKGAFLGGASALLFPIDWPEPFGLVMIEALACGVPVVAFRGGSVPEIIDHGSTGFIVESLDEAVAAARRVTLLDRAHCRETFERRFSVTRMAADYVRLYELVRQNGARASA
jgi:glycosyltransferase involved in cell wall biosynthesis